MNSAYIIIFLHIACIASHVYAAEDKQPHVRVTLTLTAPQPEPNSPAKREPTYVVVTRSQLEELLKQAPHIGQDGGVTHYLIDPTLLLTPIKLAEVTRQCSPLSLADTLAQAHNLREQQLSGTTPNG